MLVITFLGGNVSADAMWAIGDIWYGILGWINMLGLLALSSVIYKAIRDYGKQRKDGLDPIFNPWALDIQSADFWVEETQRATENQEILASEPPGE